MRAGPVKAGSALQRSKDPRPMFWRILPHASACISAERIYLLDIRQDRYFQIPEPSTCGMRDWLERNYPCAPPAPVLELLHRASVHRDGDDAPTNGLKNRVTVPETIASLPCRGSRRPSRPTFRGVLGASLRLRSKSFQSIITRRRLRLPLPIHADSTAALEMADRFERARVLVPIARDCLLDSLALDTMLARHALGSEFVFGIATQPFEAHCWLQTRDAILNDSFDHVSRFTPILTL